MYLLDTNIVIFYFKNRFEVVSRMNQVGIQNCFISEITITELKYGALKSSRPEHHFRKLAEFLTVIKVIPVIGVLDVYAQEKVRLEKIGNKIDEFDLLIGATAVTNDLIMVTNNISHLGRIENIKIEDWTVLLTNP